MATLEQRATAHRPERHSSIWGWAGATALVVVAWHLWGRGLLGINDYVAGVVLLAGINIILAVSLNVINGVTGQFSIGHAGFMAVGAYVAAVITVFGGTALEVAAAGGVLDPANPPLNLFLIAGDEAGLGWLVQARGQLLFLVALLGGGLVAALFGVAVGLPTLRLRGDYLAIATLGFGEIVRVVLLNLEVVGGASGFTGVEPFYKIPQYSNFINVYFWAAGCVLAVTALKRSAPGRALLAIREDEVAAEAVGIDTTGYKVKAFAFSAFFAGVAGGLLGHSLPLIIPSPSMFGFMRSIEVIVMVVLGGSGSTTGCVLAAVVLTMLPEWLRELAEYRMVLYAEVLLVMMLVRRQGLLGTRELTSWDWFRFAWFLRQNGPVGVVRSAWRWLREQAAALRSRLFIAGQARLTGWLATVLLALPFADLLAIWLLPRAGARASYAAEIVSSLSGLVAPVLSRLPNLDSVVAQLNLPLAPNTGLTIALLPVLLAWAQLAFLLARGKRRAAGLGLATMFVAGWHGLGLMVQDQGGSRAVVEVVVAGAMGLALALWLWRCGRKGAV